MRRADVGAWREAQLGGRELQQQLASGLGDVGAAADRNVPGGSCAGGGGRGRSAGVGGGGGGGREEGPEKAGHH